MHHRSRGRRGRVHKTSHRSLRRMRLSLHLSFGPNEFLHNEELSLYCLEGGEVIRASQPEWKEPQMDPTVMWRAKKVRRKEKKNVAHGHA